jgi:hypothetical protein
MTRHKTIGQDTPFLTYAIFTRIAARKAKEDRRRLLKQRIKAEVRTVIYNLRADVSTLLRTQSLLRTKPSIEGKTHAF